MPIEQICTIVEAAKLNEYAYSFTLEVGDMVKKEGLMAGQFLHIACGEGLLLRRPISVCMVQEDEPQDTARVVFEVRGEGTKWLAQRQVGDKVNVLGPLGNGFTVTPNDGQSADSGSSGGSLSVYDGDVTVSADSVTVITADGTTTVSAPVTVLTDSGSYSTGSGTATSSGSGEGWTISGGGYGHNIGMSQWGAYAMGLQGYTYREILQFYYTGITIQ